MRTCVRRLSLSYMLTSCGCLHADVLRTLYLIGKIKLFEIMEFNGFDCTREALSNRGTSWVMNDEWMTHAPDWVPEPKFEPKSH